VIIGEIEVDGRRAGSRVNIQLVSHHSNPQIIALSAKKE
jgi:hypothetical protein